MIKYHEISTKFMYRDTVICCTRVTIQKENVTRNFGPGSMFLIHSKRAFKSVYGNYYYSIVKKSMVIVTVRTEG